MKNKKVAVDYDIYSYYYPINKFLTKEELEKIRKKELKHNRNKKLKKLNEMYIVS